MMTTAREVACFFINKDSDRKIFNKILVYRNNRNFYEGNAKLNKFLHLAQNIYFAKTGELLFSDTLYAYDNGAVVPEVQEKYTFLLNHCRDKRIKENIDASTKEFLEKFFLIFKEADLEELISLSHEDTEWERKSTFPRKEDQQMDTISMLPEYQEQYADIIEVMNRMN